jgi:hypothetical protein
MTNSVDDVVWSKTKKNVEEVIKKYVYYNLSVDNCSTSKIDDEYMLGKLELDIQDKYILFDDGEKLNRLDYINYFRFSFNKLTKEERKIIYWTYLDKEDRFDDRFIADSLGFSLGYYYIKKKQTLIRFAYCLGVEELEDEEN